MRPTSTLAVELHGSAERYALRAIDAYLNDNWPDFALLAGVAIEHLAKARLADENPAFIAARDDFASMLALSRYAGGSNLLAQQVRTIGATEAIKRVKRLLAGDVDVSWDVRSLIDQRNGEAHLATIDASVARRDLEVFLRAATDLIGDEDGEDTGFWSVHFEFVDSVLSEAMEAEEKRVRHKIAAAETLFWERYGSLNDHERAAALHALRAMIDVEENERIRECPVCPGPAVVTGLADVTDLEIPPVADEDFAALAARPVVTFFAHELDCHACRLTLDGETELRLAGAETSWHDEDYDPALFSDPYYGAEVDEDDRSPEGL